MCLSFFPEYLKHPPDDVLDDRRVQRIHYTLTLSFIEHEPCLLQMLKMVGDARLANMKLIGDLTCAHAPISEQPQDVPTGRISQRFERIVHTLFTPYLDI